MSPELESPTPVSTRSLGRDFGLTGGAYLAGVILVFLLASLVLKQQVSLASCVADRVVWIGLLLVLTLAGLTRRGVGERHIIAGFWLCFALFVLTLLLFGDDRLEQYGDMNLIVRFARKGMTIAKWLAGTALLNLIHDFILWMSPLENSFDVFSIAGTRRHLAEFTALLMLGSTAYFLYRWPGRLSILLPVSTPIWFLFSSGYVEYYPLIVPAYLAALVWIFDRPFSERGGHWIGALAAVLFPLLYIGFIPIALALVGIYCLEQPRRTPVVMASAAATGLLGIALLWPDTFSTYGFMLRTHFNLGERNLFYIPYVGQSAGAHSIFLKTSFALSSQHLREVLFLYTFGTGVSILPLLLIAAWKSLPRPFAGGPWLRDGRVWLGVVIVMWQLIYLVWMMPKFGPLRDIDLFFVTYIPLAFFAGRLLDLQPALSVGSEAGLRGPLLAGVLGCSAASTSMLVIGGLRLPV